MLTILSSLLSKPVPGPGDLSGGFHIHWGSIWNVELLEANDPLPRSELNDMDGFEYSPFQLEPQVHSLFGSVVWSVFRADVISCHF